jgi:uncharacterized membrane protein YvbJ
MTIVKCPECGNELSDRAETCPKCGCPLHEKVQTIEKTSKKLKLQMLLCRPLIILGMLVGFMGLVMETPTTMILGIVVFAAAFLWFGTLRFLIWWHHG